MIKKILLIIASCVILISVSACNNTSKNNHESNDISKNESGKPINIAEKSIVVYFSWSGNTESVAKEIQNQTQSDIFKIEPITSYTSDYDDLLDIAQKEQKGNERPEISNKIENLNDYDVIYLGFPNWYYDMPMILYSFLDEYDLSNKKIAPFVTSGGSGFSDAISTIQNMEPNASVLDGLHIGESNAKKANNEIKEWLENLGFIN